MCEKGAVTADVLCTAGHQPMMEVAGVTFSGSDSVSVPKFLNPVSSEISDLCKISNLLLFLSYFASQNEEIKPGNYFFDVCCVN